MIHIVTAENRHLFKHALMNMHRQRKSVFIDELRWRLNAPQGLEIDDFDAADTTYLIDALDPRAPVRASSRLLPTTRPHLMSEVFADLCSDGVPRAENVWEASRFCPGDHATTGQERRALLGPMIAGIMETALLFGIDKVTYVAGAAMAPLARDAGWKTTSLGPSRRLGRDRVTAFIADIDADGLKQVRARSGIGAPATRFTPGDLRRAA